MSRLDPRRAFIAAFVTMLPPMLLLPQLAAEWFQIGWDHDPRFFDVYLFPWMLLDWVYRKTGWWGGQSYAVAIQEIVVGVVGACGIASVLKRSSAWQEHARLRAFIAVLGTLLPWWQLMRYIGGPHYYHVAFAGFSIAYCLAVVGAFVLSSTRLSQVALLAAGLLIGVAFAAWRLEPWGWFHSRSLVASFGLLIYAVMSVASNESVV